MTEIFITRFPLKKSESVSQFLFCFTIEIIYSTTLVYFYTWLSWWPVAKKPMQRIVKLSRWATGDWTLTPYQRRKLAIWRNSSDTPSAPKIALFLDEMQKKQTKSRREINSWWCRKRNGIVGKRGNTHTHTHTPGKWWGREEPNGGSIEVQQRWSESCYRAIRLDGRRTMKAHLDGVADHKGHWRLQPIRSFGRLPPTESRPLLPQSIWPSSADSFCKDEADLRAKLGTWEKPAKDR